MRVIFVHHVVRSRFTATKYFMFIFPKNIFGVFVDAKIDDVTNISQFLLSFALLKVVNTNQLVASSINFLPQFSEPPKIKLI